MELTIWV